MEGGANEEGLEYEKKRNRRIRENQEKLRSLGLSIQSSNSPRRKIKKGAFVDKEEEEEEEYLPSNSGDDTGDEGNFRGKSEPPKYKKRNVRVDGKNEKQVGATELEDNEGFNEEQALQKAISLSLGEKPHDGLKTSKKGESGRKPKFAENAGRGKKIKGNARRWVQVSEDEAVAYFFSFDEAGKGGITVRDIQKMAKEHDFIWSEKEFADMVYFFDSNGDGKLNLSDFRSILSRCNMMEGTLNS